MLAWIVGQDVKVLKENVNGVVTKDTAAENVGLQEMVAMDLLVENGDIPVL